MRFADVDLYADENRLEQVTVVTATPQTNPNWLIQELLGRCENYDLIDCTVDRPSFSNSENDDTIAILTHVELPILAASISALDLLEQIKNLTKKRQVVICLTLSSALVNDYYHTGGELARFATSLLHEANLIVQLQPLHTGRSRDITGRLVISRGPKSVTEKKVNEREFFYLVGLKGQVELRATE